MSITGETSNSPPSQSAQRTYHSPADVDIAEHKFRNEPSSLQEDPDVSEDVVYRVTPGSRITETQLKSCAAAFSRHYGVWSKIAPFELGAWAEAGMSQALRYLEQCRC
jgi:hypothetical protein